MFDPNSSLQSQNATLLVVVVINALIVFGLVWFILRQSRRIARLEAALRPKYGFLGKPLFSAMAMVLLMSGFLVTYYVSTGQLGDQSVVDEYKIELSIDTEIGRSTAEGTEVNISVIPSMRGQAWGGNANLQVDVFWSISGPKPASELELDRSADSPSGFQIILPSGHYQIRADVNHLGRTISKVITLNVP